MFHRHSPQFYRSSQDYLKLYKHYAKKENATSMSPVELEPKSISDPEPEGTSEPGPEPTVEPEPEGSRIKNYK